MICPDENTFARVQAALLSADEMAEFHRHLDDCPACLELAGALGCLYDTEPALGGEQLGQGKRGRSPVPELALRSATTGTATRERQHSRESLVALGTAVAAHAYFTLALVPIFWRAWLAKSAPEPLLPQLAPLGSLQFVVVTYVIVWGLAGLLWAAIAWVGLLSRRRWARVAVVSYAWLSLPSLLLAPLAWCVIAALKQQTANRPLRRVWVQETDHL
jgi:hypothetical protein